jgi:prophage regulatory protein
MFQSIDGTKIPPECSNSHRIQDNVMTTDSADRIVRFEEVLSRTGLTRSTLYRKIASRTFPKQIAISARCRGWRESELNDWLHNPMSYEQDEPAA